MSNLRLINKTSISASANTFSITDIFTSDFSIYKLQLKDFVNDSACYLNARFINSSGSVVATSYDNAQHLTDFGSTSSDNNSTSRTQIEYLSYFGSGATNNTDLTMYIFNPYLSSSYTFLLNQGMGYIGRGQHSKSLSVLKQTSVITGIQFSAEYVSSIDLTSGTVKTYGLRVDS